jgi:rhodanese-related sulfurtransferase
MAPFHDSPPDDGVRDDRERVEHVRCAELERWLAEGRPCTVLDVRTEAEWRSHRLAGARLVPLDQLEARIEEVLALPGPLIVHCEHGVRSLGAARFLLSRGRTDVLNVVEGLAAWRGPLERGSPESPPR